MVKWTGTGGGQRAEHPQQVRQGQIHGGVSDPMPRGYRSIIVAALGCLTLANVAKDENGQGQKQQGERSANQAQPTPSTIPPTPSPDASNKPEQGCKGTAEPSLSCDAISAQAALDQARYAHWQALTGFIGLAIGGLTLVAAFLAARWAKAAAQYTEAGSIQATRSADEGKRSADAAHQSNRPWLRLEMPEFCELQISPAEPIPHHLAIQVALPVRNFGNSPALKPSVGYVVCSAENMERASKIARAAATVGTSLHSAPIFMNEPTVLAAHFLKQLAIPSGLTRKSFIEQPAKWIVGIQIAYQSVNGETYYVGDVYSLTQAVDDGIHIKCSLNTLFGGDLYECT